MYVLTFAWNMNPEMDMIVQQLCRMTGSCWLNVETLQLISEQNVEVFEKIHSGPHVHRPLRNHTKQPCFDNNPVIFQIKRALESFIASCIRNLQSKVIAACVADSWCSSMLEQIVSHVFNMP